MQRIDAPPTPPDVPRITIVRPGSTPVIVGGGDSPLAVYRAQVAQRSELGDQLERLQRERNSLRGELDDRPMSPADRAGVEARMTAIDARIAAVDKQIGQADADVARAAGIPGAVVEDPPMPRTGPPEAMYVLSGMFILVAILPISLAYARRIWRRSAAAVSSLPQEVVDRLTRLDHAVDSIAVEVERIGEGQRFMTRVLSSKGEPVSVPVRTSSEPGGPR
ncbi:MAG: hypothetical protein ABIV10_02240 [Gemmatimonadaceae bacterium]